MGKGGVLSHFIFLIINFMREGEMEHWEGWSFGSFYFDHQFLHHKEEHWDGEGSKHLLHCF